MKSSMPEARHDWWTEAVADFTGNLGFRGSGNGPQAVLNLSVDNGRYFVDVERNENELLLAVFRRVTLREVEDKITLLLRACSYDNHQPFFVQAGLQGEETLVLSARLERSEANRLFAAFELIRKLYDETGL